MEIDMPAFEQYITNMNVVVDNIVYLNRVFTQTIQALETEGWRDDVFRMGHNLLMGMQGETNRFIDILYEIDSDLVNWYCRLYEEYFRRDYARPRLNMSYVAIIPELVERHDDKVNTDTAPMDRYTAATRAYIDGITVELTNFDLCHRSFFESFRTARYDRLTEELRIPITKMVEILGLLEAHIQDIDPRKGVIEGLG